MVGRADLNAAGVIAFEGEGGLPGSHSSPNDREIFVHDREIATLIQLTDDDTAVVAGAGGCGMADLVVMRRALAGRAPAPEQVCPAALPWL